MSRRICLLIVLTLILALTSVYADEGFVFGYSAPGLGDEGQMNIQKGFEIGCRDLGIKCITTNAQMNAEKQLRDIETLIARGVDAICAVPYDSKAIGQAVKAAMEAGIPFFTIDRGVLEGKVVMTVMADNYDAAAQAGMALVRLLQGKYHGVAKGKILEIMGNPAQDVAQLRHQGFIDVVSQYPDIEVISKPGYWNTDEGYKIVLDVLTANPDIDAIYFHADLYIPGIIEAIKAVKGTFKKVGEEGHIFIVGIDGNPMALDYIRKGFIDGDMIQPLREYGKFIVPYIKAYLEKGEEALPKPGLIVKEGSPYFPAVVVDTPHGLVAKMKTYYVDKHNVDDPTLWGNIPLEKEKLETTK